MAMKENFISMAPDEESSAKVSLIDQNKTLMIDLTPVMSRQVILSSWRIFRISTMPSITSSRK